MRISVITVCLNQGKFIEDNILSVLNQSYKNVEHIIVDGGSIDETLSILRKYNHLNWISEKDSGQSEAFNKGIKMSSGDLVLFLNSDDYLLNSDVFMNLIISISKLDLSNYSGIMTNTVVVNQKNEELAIMKGKNRIYDFDTLLNKYPVVIHPSTFFFRKNILQTNGYNEKLHYNMDYDFFLKLSYTNPIISLDLSTSALRRHDESKGCGNNDWKFSYEFIKIRKEFGGNFFSKLSVQPVKEIIKNKIGTKTISWMKRNYLIMKIINFIGLNKFNRLTWYEKSK